MPVDTMVWLGSVVMVASIGTGILVSGALAAGPMQAMVADEAKAGIQVREREDVPVVALAR